MPSRPPTLRNRKTRPARKPSNWRPKGSRHERGYGIEHVRMREQVLREEPLCRDCGERGLVTASDTADHIVPLNEGGTSERSNYQGLCTPCHKAKTARESAAARRRR